MHMHTTILATIFEISRTAVSMCIAGILLFFVALWAALVLCATLWAALVLCAILGWLTTVPRCAGRLDIPTTA